MTWIAAIVGVDDGGPYEIIGPDETDSDTPQGAFENVRGFWNEVDTTGVRRMHIRVFQDEDYVYAWVPTTPKVLRGVYRAMDIEMETL